MEIDYHKKYQKKRFVERMALARESLGNMCVRCSKTEEVLVFDHIDPNTKVYNISEICNLSAVKFVLELSKCQLLCRSCHGKKTATENGKKLSACGTITGYNNCRCMLCKAAKREYMQKYNARKRSDSLTDKAGSS